MRCLIRFSCFRFWISQEPLVANQAIEELWVREWGQWTCRASPFLLSWPARLQRVCQNFAFQRTNPQSHRNKLRLPQREAKTYRYKQWVCMKKLYTDCSFKTFLFLDQDYPRRRQKFPLLRVQPRVSWFLRVHWTNLWRWPRCLYLVYDGGWQPQ